MSFVFSFFIEFFSGYDFVEFANWTIWEFFYTIIIIDWKTEEQHFVIRMYTSFYSFERSWWLCGLWDRRTGADKTLLYWPITSSLDPSTLRNLQDPFRTSDSRPGLPQAPAGALSVNASWLWLWPLLSPTLSIGGHLIGGSSLQWGALTDWKVALTLIFTASNWLNFHRHRHILFHNVHLLPIRSHYLLPLIYTGASLTDDSVKGQYVTYIYIYIYIYIYKEIPNPTSCWVYIFFN